MAEVRPVRRAKRDKMDCSTVHKNTAHTAFSFMVSWFSGRITIWLQSFAQEMRLHKLEYVLLIGIGRGRKCRFPNKDYRKYGTREKKKGGGEEKKMVTLGGEVKYWQGVNKCVL